MRFIPLALAAGVFLFMGQSLGRTLYIDWFEFKPAATEWHQAHDRGDRDGMQQAYHKEEIAYCRAIDPFWFSAKWRNDCPR
jgi:hypothetical protein